MKKRYITLTFLESEIKEEVLAKIESIENPRDEHGRSEEDYVNIGIPVPEFFKKKGNVDKEFDNIENYDFIPLTIKIQPDKITHIVADEINGSFVHYNEKHIYYVDESPDEIEAIINDFDKYNK